MNFYLMSTDHPYRRFLSDLIKNSGEFHVGKKPIKEFKTFFIYDSYPDSLVDPTSEKQMAVVLANDVGLGINAKAEFSMPTFGTSPLMHGAHTNPEFATLQAAQFRLPISPHRNGGILRNLAFLCTDKGIVKTPLELSFLTNLFPTVAVPSVEGLLLKNASPKEEFNFLPKLEELCNLWQYHGFVFITIEEDKWDKHILRISPYAPKPFWPCFAQGFQDNLAKFFWKTCSSRKLMSTLKFKDTLTMKLSLPPYPYTSCPWVSKEARPSVESWMRQGAAGIAIDDSIDAGDDASVVWYDIENGVTTGAEIGFVSGHTKKSIEKTISKIQIPNLQHREIPKFEPMSVAIGNKVMVKV